MWSRNILPHFGSQRMYRYTFPLSWIWPDLLSPCNGCSSQMALHISSSWLDPWNLSSMRCLIHLILYQRLLKWLSRTWQMMQGCQPSSLSSSLVISKWSAKNKVDVASDTKIHFARSLESIPKRNFLAKRFLERLLLLRGHGPDSNDVVALQKAITWPSLVGSAELTLTWLLPESTIYFTDLADSAWLPSLFMAMYTYLIVTGKSLRISCLSERVLSCI